MNSESKGQIEMLNIGHIEDIQQIPPEIADLTNCELCNPHRADFIAIMNPKFSEDIYVCSYCLEKVIAINKMLVYLEN